MKKAFVHGIVTTAAIVAGLVTVTAFDAEAQIVAVNTGSLGPAGNGTHLADVAGTENNPLAALGGVAGLYDGATTSRSEVPFLPALNPAASQPFTIELWLKPTLSSNDSSPLFNRKTDGDRTGWVFFQRDDVAWNFRMYNGNGGTVGWDLTGGSAALDVWHYIVVVWDGMNAKMYHNGVDTNAVNAGAGGYQPNVGSEVLSIGRYDTGATPFTGGLDEIAFYSTALTPAQIANHFSKAASLVAGEYSSQVIADGAVEYLQFTELVPEPGLAVMLVLAGGFFATRRRRW